MSSSNPGTLTRVLRLALPGLVVVWAVGGGLVAAGVPANVPAHMVWLGLGAGSLIGVASIAVIEAAARFRPATADGGQQIGLSIQVAAAATLVLKLVGVAALLLWGFSTGLKFPVLMALGVAFAWAAVCIQILGSMALARKISARGAGQHRPGASADPSRSSAMASDGTLIRILTPRLS